jgi:hypothetical protein
LKLVRITLAEASDLTAHLLDASPTAFAPRRSTDNEKDHAKAKNTPVPD